MQQYTQNKPVTLELQKAAAALKCKLISGNVKTEDPRKINWCWPRWSRGNVLASRSKVCGFKPD